MYDAYDMELIYAQAGAGKVMKGKDTGYFGLDDLITRGETLRVLEKISSFDGFNNNKLKELKELSNRPETSITRGDFAKALCIAFKFDDVKAKAKSKVKFDTLKHRHAEYVEKLAPLGVLDVYKGEREFKFGRPVTRGEAADMLARAMAL